LIFGLCTWNCSCIGDFVRCRLVLGCASWENVGLLAGLLEVLRDCHSVVLSLIRKTARITPFSSYLWGTWRNCQRILHQCENNSKVSRQKVCENFASLPGFRTVDCRPLLGSFLTLMGPVSSHTRQRFPLYQVKCRVTHDSAFRCTRSNVESHSTALSAGPGPMSS
jgi:hypothetical protein